IPSLEGLWVLSVPIPVVFSEIVSRLSSEEPEKNHRRHLGFWKAAVACVLSRLRLSGLRHPFRGGPGGAWVTLRLVIPPCQARRQAYRATMLWTVDLVRPS